MEVMVGSAKGHIGVTVLIMTLIESTKSRDCEIAITYLYCSSVAVVNKWNRFANIVVDNTSKVARFVHRAGNGSLNYRLP